MEDNGSVERAFGHALRARRQAGGLTQEALAAAADLARNYVSELERGTKSPSLRTIFRLCEQLRVSPVVLMSEVTERL